MMLKTRSYISGSMLLVLLMLTCGMATTLEMESCKLGGCGWLVHGLFNDLGRESGQDL